MEEHNLLNNGDILKEGDEYSTSNGLWRFIPDFMVGNTIPTSDTKWRRVKEGKPPKKKKRWFEK